MWCLWARTVRPHLKYACFGSDPITEGALNIMRPVDDAVLPIESILAYLGAL